MANNKKKYYNISEVSEILGIEEHKIRYWDSIDPRTSKKRIEGLCVKSKKGTRYFNSENIQRLQKLKNILYDGRAQNYSLKLANIILNTKKNSSNEKNYEKEGISSDLEKSKKINQILYKIKNLLKND